MTVKIYRCGDTVPEGQFDTFTVPVPADDSWTVTDVLDYIAMHCDSTVAYYKHSVCGHGICGRCLLTVNGRQRLACTDIVDPAGELILEPALNREKIRDLVTREVQYIE